MNYGQITNNRKIKLDYSVITEGLNPNARILKKENIVFLKTMFISCKIMDLQQ